MMKLLGKTLNAVRLSRQSGVVLGVLLLAASSAPTLKAAPLDNINIAPTITGLIFTNGQLLATGIASITRNGHTTTAPFTVPLGIGVNTNLSTSNGCSLLNLSLAPLNLNLLGIEIATSPICVDVSSIPGGGLLSDLVCDLSGLLGGGLNLGQILNGVGSPTLPGLTPAELNNLLGGLSTLLNGILGNLTNAVLVDLTNPGGGACGQASLALGPINLSLLGVNVSADNCFEGPITVDIRGSRGRNSQLGSLLCAALRSNRINLGDTLGDILSQLPGIR